MSAARTRAARRHALRTWTCPICGTVARGNGGKSSHQRMHVRQQGLAGETFAAVARRLRDGSGGVDTYDCDDTGSSD